MTTPSADVVILTALPEEDDAIVAALGNCEEYRWRGSAVHQGKVGSLDVLAVPMSGMGNPSSAYASTMAINIWNPASLLLVGIAGGIPNDDDLRLGDVLVPDRVIDYEHAKVEESGVQRRYDAYHPDWNLLETARSLNPADWALSVAAHRPDGQGGRIIPRAFFEPVFSGEKVIADETTTTELRRDWPKAVGVEMEGLGVALASYRGGPGFLMVKSVSDFADPKKTMTGTIMRPSPLPALQLQSSKRHRYTRKQGAHKRSPYWLRRNSLAR